MARKRTKEEEKLKKRKQRQETKNRIHLRIIDRQSKQKRRKDDEKRDRDLEINRLVQQKRRKDYEKRERDQEINRLAQQRRRQDQEKLQKDQEIDRLAKQRRRQDEEKRERDKEINRLVQQKRRQDEEKRARDQVIDRLAKQRQRQDEEKRERDKEINRLVQQKRRQDEEKRARDQEIDRLAKQRRRQDEEKRERDQDINKLVQQKRRQDEEKRQRDQEINKSVQKKRRLIDDNRDNENRVKQIKRQNHEYRDQERTSDRISHHIHRRNKDISELEMQFRKAIAEGPTHICSSCNGLWFKSSITHTNVQKLIEKGLDILFIGDVCNTMDQTSIKLCKTCARDILNGKIPRLSLCNGLRLPQIPCELKDLTQLEKRMVALRIPFMQIRRLGVDRQFGLKGNIVNVPIDLDTSVSILPRTYDKTYTIQLKLKRKAGYKHHYMFETIRPASVMSALIWLLDTELYIQENITIDKRFLADSKETEFIIDPTDKEIDDSIETSLNFIREEVDEIINFEDSETLLEDLNANSLITYAPGEGKIPFSLFMDKYAEELAFPKIYCGKPREYKVKLSYTEIAKSEHRYSDGRCNNIAKLLYTYKKKQIKCIKDQISLHMRKSQFSNCNVTAGNVLDESFVDLLVQNNDGYRFLRCDRSSPAFWEEKRRELLAMIRMLGIPTIFLTLSAAEMKWSELLIILSLNVDKKLITEEDVNAMKTHEKYRLISSDPMTCARYFDKRIRELFKVLKQPSGPFGNHSIVDYYIRTEFQFRGSPHVHCVLWLKDAPVYINGDFLSELDVTTFIDSIITTESNNEEMSDLLKLQKHNHSETCKRFSKGTRICRFGIPYYPMPCTRVLVPIVEGECNDAQMDELVELLKDIKEYITRRIENNETSIEFKQLLIDLHIDCPTYVLALRTELKQPKVFLRRQFNALMINAFNTDILRLHRANMDIQYILNAYSIARYILDYINKAQRGMSKLLRDAIKDINDGNHSIKERLKTVCNKFLNASEISAQEASYHILGMPVSQSSRGSIFINTGEVDTRTKVVKSRDALRELSSDSTDIYTQGLLDYYAHRPISLEDLNLADFAAKYDYFKKRPNIKSAITLEDGDEDYEHREESNICLKQKFELQNNLGWIVERTKPKVIRYRRYNRHSDERNFYREKIMLYIPWRCEYNDLINVDIEQKFKDNLNIIKERALTYDHKGSDDFEEYCNNVERQDYDFEDNDCDIQELDNEFSVFNTGNSNADIGNEIFDTIPKSNIEDKFLKPKVFPETEYFPLVAKLNERQRNYLYELMSRIKQQSKPFYHVLMGGAGTGKSLLIKAIDQSVQRYFNRIPGATPDHVTVVKCAPTGKAAFNIGGMTIHSTFHLQHIQNRNEMPRLGQDLLNTVRCNLSALKLIIIDEFSMVGAQMIECVDKRLKEIFQSTEIFGGISVILVGDLHQLKPVMDSFLFKRNNQNAYSALVEPIIWNAFTAYELTDIMRQKDDLLFAQALNNLSNSCMTVKDIELLSSRCVDMSRSSTIPETAIRLYRTNAEVNHYNDIKLNSGEPSIVHKAYDITVGEGTTSARLDLLNRVANLDAKDCYGLPPQIHLKIGIKYMITSNIKTDDGLVNGATGVLKHIQFSCDRNGSLIPVRLWIDFIDENVGKSARNDKNHLIKRLKCDNCWTPIEEIVREKQLTKSARLRIRRKQFPIVPCEAMTITKSQGQTYDSVAVRIENKTSKSEMYVGLSRAKSSSGLYIDGKFRVPRETTLDSEVNNEINRLRTEAKLNFLLRFPKDYKTQSNISLIYHNIQSFNKHEDIIRCDSNYMGADILMFSETLLCSSDTPFMNNFQIVGRTDGNIRRHGFGQIIFAKTQTSFISSGSRFFGKEHIESIVIDVRTLVIVSVYSSPNCNIFEVTNYLKQIMDNCNRFSKNQIYVGDFNIRTDSKQFCQLENFFNTHGFYLQIEKGISSTDGNTQIDLIFSNVKLEATYYYESLCSYHKPIFFCVEKTQK